MRKIKRSMVQPQAAYRLPVQPISKKVWMSFNSCVSAFIPYVSWRLCAVVSLKTVFVPLKNFTVWINNLTALLYHSIISI